MSHDFTQWWKDWWEQDYSWEGLAQKPWAGWCVNQKGEITEDPSNWPEEHEKYKPMPKGARKANLQDYWRDQKNTLLVSPVSGKRFTIIHLPLAWEDGSETQIVDQIAQLKSKFASAKATEFVFVSEFEFEFENLGIKGPDNNVQCQGAVLRNFNIKDCTKSEIENDQIPTHISTENCFFSGCAVFENAAFSGNARFNSAAFSGDARFDNAAFSGEASFKSAAFSGVAIFLHAAFSRYACFNNVAFSGIAGFAYTAFSGDAGFVNAAFSGMVSFSEAAFSGNAVFDNAAFSGMASFDKAAFSGQAGFVDTAFAGDAGFNDTAFSGYAGFHRAAFLRSAGFLNVAFTGNVSFYKAAFSRYACFNHVAFSGDTDFNKVAFLGDAGFDNAAFTGYAIFENAIFAQDANFSGQGTVFSQAKQVQKLELMAPSKDGLGLIGTMTMPESLLPMARRSFKSIDASGAIFIKEAIFDNRDIYEPSSFRDCLFMKRASFHGSKLHQGVSFHGAIFEPSLNPAKQCLDFANKEAFYQVPARALMCLHEAESRRREILSEEPIDFGNWQNEFEKNRSEAAKKFCQLPQKTPDGETGESKDRYFADLEDAFRTLKRAMEDNRNRPEEGRFFKLELQARRRRRRPAVPWWERALSDLYLWSSDFGNSVILPLVWILASTIAFTIFYAMLATLRVKIPNFDDIVNAASFSISNVLPFGPWAQEQAPCTAMGRLLDIAPNAIDLNANGSCKSAPEFAAQYGAVTALGIRLFASLQSLISLILVFLAALAARRRFQIN